MKKYNCIALFNEDKSKILFCKRKKNPYLGLYNFVGGKVEPGEESMDAAYRELYEETGVRKEEVQLYRLMDVRYYTQDYTLELFVGMISEDRKLVEEINALVWIPITEDFTNINKFAGDYNMAHIVHMALQHPFNDRTIPFPY